MSALRGMRGVVAPPFYLVVSPMVGAAVAILTAVVAGAIRGESPADLDSWGGWGEVITRGWLMVVAGLSLGLAAGAMGLQGARPSVDSDPGGTWLGRASRTLFSAAVGGLAGALAALGVREYAGQGAAVLLVVVLLIAAVLWAIVATIPGFRGRGYEKDVTSARPTKGVH